MAVEVTRHIKETVGRELWARAAGAASLVVVIRSSIGRQ